MKSTEQIIEDFLTSNVDDTDATTKILEERGVSITDTLISILQDTVESASDKYAHEDKRIKAAYGLKKLRDPRGIPALIHVLREPDEGLNLAASSALVSIGAQAVEPLISALSHQDRHFRFFAIHTLGKLLDKRAVEPLISLLQDPQIGWVAAGALGELGDPRAVVPLIHTIQTCEPAQCRPFIAALGKIGDPKAIQVLIERLSDLPDWVYTAVAEALAAMGETAKKPLLEYLNSADQHSRERAAIALGYMGLPDGIQILKILLRTSPSVYIRSGAACALGIIQDPCALDSLILAIEDPASGVSREAIRAIGRIGVSTNATSKALISALDLADDDPFVIREVVFALSSIGDERAIPELERLICQDDESLIFHSREKEGTLGDLASHAIEQIKSRANNS